jgi:hypothetical protein
LKRIIALLATLATAISFSFLAASAAGAAVGPRVFSGEEGGFQASGAQFRFVRTTFVLPDAGNFAADAGSFGLSVQLWSADQAHILGISTCGTDTCHLGGIVIHSEGWNAGVAVYDPVSHALLHSNGASPVMAAGDTITEAMYYNRTTGFVNYSVFDATAGTQFTDSFHVGPAEHFRVARIGAEFSVDPFTVAPFSNPAIKTHLVTFRNIRLTTYSGFRSGLFAWWVRSKIEMTSNGLGSGNPEVLPNTPFNNGLAFGDYLLP